MSEFRHIFESKARALGDADREEAARRNEQELRRQAEERLQDEQRLIKAQAEDAKNKKSELLFDWVGATILHESVDSLRQFLNRNIEDPSLHWQQFAVKNKIRVSKVVYPRTGPDDNYVPPDTISSYADYSGILLRRIGFQTVFQERNFNFEDIFMGTYSIGGFYSGEEVLISRDLKSHVSRLDRGYFHVSTNAVKKRANFTDADEALRRMMGKIHEDGRPKDIVSVNLFDGYEDTGENRKDNLTWGMTDRNSQIFKDAAQRLGAGLADFAAKNIPDFPRK